MLCIRVEASAQEKCGQPDVAEQLKQGLGKIHMYARKCYLKSNMNTAHTNLYPDREIGQFVHWVLLKLGFNAFSTYSD